MDDPAPLAYVKWLWGILHLDFGKSVLGRTSLLEEIAWRWPVTIELSIFAMFFTIVIGVPLGILAA